MNFILKLILALALSIYQSKVLSDIWNWFISPYFGIKGLKLIPAMGISLFITVAHLKSNFEKEEETSLESFFDGCVKSAWVLLSLQFIAWVITFFK